MVDRRLARKLRRINDGPGPPRGLLALACAASAVLAGFAWAEAASPLWPWGLLALLAGLGWLRRYQAARPLAATVVTHVAIGAFVGGLAAGLALEAPVTAREWLRTPAADGGPPAALVVLAALVEDLLAAARARLAGHR